MKNRKFKSRYTNEWNEAAGLVARAHCPAIFPCSDCNAPVIKGYCCTYCGSANPTRPLTSKEIDEQIKLDLEVFNK